MTHDEFIDFLAQELFNCVFAAMNMPMELCFLIISYLPRAKIIGQADVNITNQLNQLEIQIISPLQYISGRIATVFSTIVCD